MAIHKFRYWKGQGDKHVYVCVCGWGTPPGKPRACHLAMKEHVETNKE